MCKYLKRVERLLARRTLNAVARTPELSVSIFLEENRSIAPARRLGSNFEYIEDNLNTEYFQYCYNQLYKPEGLISLRKLCFQMAIDY